MLLTAVFFTGGSQCTYRCVVLPDAFAGLNAVIGAVMSQCTYRCVVLPDQNWGRASCSSSSVSMHLQVRGAP